MIKKIIKSNVVILFNKYNEEYKDQINHKITAPIIIEVVARIYFEHKIL